MTAPQPGILFTGAYLKGFYNPGVPGGATVFDALAYPPQTGENALSDAEDTLSALGVVDPPEEIAKYMTSNSDPIKDRHDAAGIQQAPWTS